MLIAQITDTHIKPKGELAYGNVVDSALSLKNVVEHCNKFNPKIDIIGSAHNPLEINEKIKQGCSQIFLSRLFETNYKYKNGFLGKIKFNLLSQSFPGNFIALGGIKEKNFSHIKDLNASGIALSSDKKKAGTYVPAFFIK